MGGLLGSLAEVPAPELAATAIAAAIERSGMHASDIDEVFMGCVLPAALKQCPARQAAIGAGIPTAAGAVTVNKACGSGMQATIFGYDSIVAGTNTVVITGGMESMSRAPHMLPGARGGIGSGHKTVCDHMFIDGLEDAYTGRAMGSFAQETVDERGITREQMDAFAIESLTRAKQAIENGSLQAEIAPVTVKTRKGEVVVRTTSSPTKQPSTKSPPAPGFRQGRLHHRGQLQLHLRWRQRPAADERSAGPGTRPQTHGPHRGPRASQPGARTNSPPHPSAPSRNCSTKPAGAWTMWICLRSTRLCHGHHAGHAGPGPGSRQGQRHGGACAQGHPIGSTGSRIIVTLMYALQQRGKQRGVAALCIGGGEATAVGIELI